MARHRSVDPAMLAAEIARLPDLGLPELRARWSDLYGRPTPRFFRRKFLVLGIAYQLQVEALGGLSSATKRKLYQFAEAKRTRDESRATVPPRIKPGTKLIRVWRDKTHTVTAREQGFEWDGAQYRSLSEVARAITGTQWNGLVFFGVKARSSTNKNASKHREDAHA
jgi:Protein of unknown function (DUF2924)